MTNVENKTKEQLQADLTELEKALAELRGTATGGRVKINAIGTAEATSQDQVQKMSEFPPLRAQDIPLRHARSQAELTRVHQGWALIVLNIGNVLIAGAVALKVFGIV